MQVTGLTDISALAAGWYHSVALKNDETIWSWGWNKYGQLGDGTFNDSISPVQASGVAGTVEIAAGAFHTLAVICCQ